MPFIITPFLTFKAPAVVHPPLVPFAPFPVVPGLRVFFPRECPVLASSFNFDFQVIAHPDGSSPIDPSTGVLTPAEYRALLAQARPLAAPMVRAYSHGEASEAYHDASPMCKRKRAICAFDDRGHPDLSCLKSPAELKEQPAHVRRRVSVCRLKTCAVWKKRNSPDLRRRSPPTFRIVDQTPAIALEADIPMQVQNYYQAYQPMEVDDSVDVDVAMASPCPEIWEDSDMAAGTGFEKVDNEAVISPVLESGPESVRRETRAERRDRRQEERCRQEADRIVRRNGYDFDAALKKAKDNPSHADPWCIPYSLRQRPAHKLPYRPPPPDVWPLKGPYLRREINRDCPVLNAVQFEDPYEGKLSEEEFEALFEDAEDEEEPAAIAPDSDDESTSSESSSVLIVMNIGSPEIVESDMVSVEVQQPVPSPMQVVIQDIVSPVLGFLDATSVALHGLGLLSLFGGSL